MTSPNTHHGAMDMWLNEDTPAEVYVDPHSKQGFALQKSKVPAGAEEPSLWVYRAKV